MQTVSEKCLQTPSPQSVGKKRTAFIINGKPKRYLLAEFFRKPIDIFLKICSNNWHYE
jgi:hypothetical protein